MQALEPFSTTLTLCFTPEHMGVAPHYTSPPRRAEDFVEFAVWAVRKYAVAKANATAKKDNRVLIGAS
jgi:galactose-1-phosphate uridylyltransferase